MSLWEAKISITKKIILDYITLAYRIYNIYNLSGKGNRNDNIYEGSSKKKKHGQQHRKTHSITLVTSC